MRDDEHHDVEDGAERWNVDDGAGPREDSAAIAAAVMPMVATHGSMMVHQLGMATQARDMLTAAQRQQLGKLPSPCMNADSNMMMKRKMPMSKR